MTHTSQAAGLLETLWRIRMPSGRILECRTYQCDRGCFETRIGYGEQRLASQCSFDLAALREAADSFRADMLDRAGYVELPIRLPSIEPFPGGRLVRHGNRTTVHGSSGGRTLARDDQAPAPSSGADAAGAAEETGRTKDTGKTVV